MSLSLIEHLVNSYQTFYIPVVLYYNDCLHCKSAVVKRIQSLLSLSLSGSLFLCVVGFLLLLCMLSMVLTFDADCCSY